jgi:hypothetical protein
MSSGFFQIPEEEEEPIYIDNKASQYLKKALDIDITPLTKSNIFPLPFII